MKGHEYEIGKQPSKAELIRRALKRHRRIRTVREKLRRIREAIGL